MTRAHRHHAIATGGLVTILIVFTAYVAAYAVTAQRWQHLFLITVHDIYTLITTTFAHSTTFLNAYYDTECIYRAMDTISDTTMTVYGIGAVMVCAACSAAAATALSAIDVDTSPPDVPDASIFLTTP